MSIKSTEIVLKGSERPPNYTTSSLPESAECVSPLKQKSFLKSLPERIPAFGIIILIASEIMFSLASLIVKVLTEMHSVEVLVFRCIVQLLPFSLIIWRERYPVFGLPGHRFDLAFRCISGTISLICLYMAYRLMPLSDASTIFMTSPVFVTIFAYFLLKEAITVIHVITGIITVIGVFIISKPEFIFGKDEIDQLYDQRILGIILASVSAICAAFTLINLRKLKTTPVPVIVMWYSVSCIIAGSIVVPILDRWVMPSSAYSWSMLLAVGICGILHQYLLTTACKYEAPGPISVARSSNIVLAFVWEVVIFAEPIEWTSILGACLIISCLVIIALAKWCRDNPDKFNEFLKRNLSFIYHKTEEKNLSSVQTLN